MKGAMQTYRKTLKTIFQLRVYSGTGPNRTYNDINVHGNEVSIFNSQSDSLVGDITQGIRKIVLLAEDIPYQLNTNIKIIIDQKEFAIQSFSRRTDGPIVLGYDVIIKG